MNWARTVVILAVVLGFGGATADAQEVPAGMTMHRVQAGELDASGWAFAASTEGFFSVSVPCKFNDYTFDLPEKNQPKNPMFMVGCQLQNGLRFSANRLSYIGRNDEAQKSYTEFSFTDPTAKVTSSVQGSQNGNEFKQLSMLRLASRPRPSECAEMRLVRSGDSNVLLVVETIGRDCFDFKSDAQKFFDSLEVSK